MSTIPTNQNQTNKVYDGINYDNCMLSKIVLVIYMIIVTIFITIMTAMAIDISLHPEVLDNLVDSKLVNIYTVSPLPSVDNISDENVYYSIKTSRSKNKYVLNVYSDDTDEINQLMIDANLIEILNLPPASIAEPVLEEYNSTVKGRKFYRLVKSYKLYIPVSTSDINPTKVA